jgi:hypothetical protein
MVAHLNEAMVGATVEIVLDCINGALDRNFSEEAGLNFIKFR